MDSLLQRFKQEKRKMNFLAILVLACFYCSLPTALTLFPDQMNKTSPVFYLPWSWLYAFIQIIMTWILGWVYWKKAKQLDQLIERLKQEM